MMAAGSRPAADLVAVLRAAGYGDPPPPDAPTHTAVAL